MGIAFYQPFTVTLRDGPHDMWRNLRICWLPAISEYDIEALCKRRKQYTLIMLIISQ